MTTYQREHTDHWQLYSLHGGYLWSHYVTYCYRLCQLPEGITEPHDALDYYLYGEH